MKRLGLIVNPIAGLGGRVGLKGSDGFEILQQARNLGAKPEAPVRALEALKVIAGFTDKIEIMTYPGEMGDAEARTAGFSPLVIGNIKGRETTSEDTIKAAIAVSEMGVDLLLFTGGDGTARNIYEAIGTKTAVLGIPAGVKIHSAVYAINPKSAGAAVVQFLKNTKAETRETEVMDIDEEAFRQGEVKAKLFGYLKVPVLKAYVQNTKAGSYSEQEAISGIAEEVVCHMEKDVVYLIGPGSTTAGIMAKLGLSNTLLGVDAVMNKQVLANDVNENQLLELVAGKRAKIIVTAIGGQGHVFGRGNQQLSPSVIREVGKENIIVVATKSKLVNLMPKPFLVDTGDADLDRELCGFTRVITGSEDYVPYKIST